MGITLHRWPWEMWKVLLNLSQKASQFLHSSCPCSCFSSWPDCLDDGQWSGQVSQPDSFLPHAVSNPDVCHSSSRHTRTEEPLRSHLQAVLSASTLWCDPQLQLQTAVFLPGRNISLWLLSFAFDVPQPMGPRQRRCFFYIGISWLDHVTFHLDHSLWWLCFFWGKLELFLEDTFY